MIYAAGKCPLDLENDPYPGKCRLYVDENGDKNCDLSQNGSSEEVQSPTPEPARQISSPVVTISKSDTPVLKASNTPPSSTLTKATPSIKAGAAVVTESSNSKNPGAKPDKAPGSKPSKDTDTPSDNPKNTEPLKSTATPQPSALPDNVIPADMANPSPDKANDAKNDAIVSKESTGDKISFRTFLVSYSEKMFDTRNLVTLIFLLIASAILFLQIRWKNFKWLRYALLCASLIYLGFVTGGCPSPIGSVQQIPVFFSSIVKGKALDWVVVFVTPIVFTIFFGRVYCGGVCPFGAVQEFIYKAGRKLKLNTYVEPGTDRILKNFRYISLAGLLILAIMTGTAWLCRFDPFASLFGFNWTAITFTASVIVLIASFIISRPFCRYICPYGILLALISKAALVFKMKKLVTWCKNCTVCEKSCPTGAIRKGSINESECIRCGECMEVCPVKARKDKDSIESMTDKVHM